ncbi:hypothetical protein GCM10018793_66020 [Streptomyces sulfonofaciens]|uniref:AG1 protein n=1 Tax=Streptomyces sulfonofaciens TaxID=68272 RepID=A0A919L8L5_9ACTN|nr:hypothetical protein [Streptomyces sulfonofaciens]GHH88017.1 hypothetical protein GCM10018793_66020 [Streptomyces sulfonofaciens]
MAWDEWEQLKAEAAGRHSARMELNSVPVDGGSTSSTPGDLKVSQKDLAAVGDAAYKLYNDFNKYSDHARLSSMDAAGGLEKEGFAIGGALDHVAVHWIDQCQNLLDACAHISNHMDYTKKAHAGDEVYIAGTLSSIAELDKGFDERKGS